MVYTTALQNILWSIIRRHSKVFNADRTLKMLKLGAKLQPFVSHDARTNKMNKLYVVSLLTIDSNRKGTLQTQCTYEHQLRTKFMEWGPLTFVSGVRKAK